MQELVGHTKQFEFCSLGNRELVKVVTGRHHDQKFIFSGFFLASPKNMVSDFRERGRGGRETSL